MNSLTSEGGDQEAALLGLKLPDTSISGRR
jgi:hypothetical protein